MAGVAFRRAGFEAKGTETRYEVRWLKLFARSDQLGAMHVLVRNMRRDLSPAITTAQIAKANENLIRSTPS